MKGAIFLSMFLATTLFVFGQKMDTLAKKGLIIKNVAGVNMSSAKELVDNLSASNEFTTLVKLINASGLANQLNAGPITFLAPTNKAFEKLHAGTIDSLMLPVNQKKLVVFLNYLTLAKQLNSKDILRLIKAGHGEAMLNAASGGIIVARINADKNFLLTDENAAQSIVLRFDIEQSNGILFVLDNVLLPVFK